MVLWQGTPGSRQFFSHLSFFLLNSCDKTVQCTPNSRSSNREQTSSFIPNLIFATTAKPTTVALTDKVGDDAVDAAVVAVGADVAAVLADTVAVALVNTGCYRG